MSGTSDELFVSDGQWLSPDRYGAERYLCTLPMGTLPVFPSNVRVDDEWFHLVGHSCTSTGKWCLQLIRLNALIPPHFQNIFVKA